MPCVEHQHAHAGILLRDRLQARPARVAAPVVDEQDLQTAGPGAHGSVQLAVQRLEALLLVVNGDHDREQRSGGHRAPASRGPGPAVWLPAHTIERVAGRAMSSLRPLGAGVLVAAAALFLVRLGATDLWAPDEPRYAQIAEEIRSFEHGARGLWLLHLNGAAYTQKPPLYFWLAALAGAPAGRVGETAARLPSALAGIACVALLIRFGTRLRGPAVGAAAGGLLATASLFTHLARRAQLDVLLCGFELVALAAFWRIDRGGPRRTRDVAVLHGALGLAVLTKGPVGLILPVLAIAAFLAWERRLAALPRCIPPWSPLLSVAPGLIWIAGAGALAPPGFADQAILENLWGRFVHGTSHARPLWYYLYRLPLDFLPWTLLAPAALAAGRRVLGAEGSEERARVWRFLLAWLGSAFVFFSLSGGKRGLYLLPAFPAAALLCADAVVSALAAGARPPRSASALLAASAALILLGGLAAPSLASRFGVDAPAGFGVLWLAVRLRRSARLPRGAPVLAAPRGRGGGERRARRAARLRLLLPRARRRKVPARRRDGGGGADPAWRKHRRHPQHPGRRARLLWTAPRDRDRDAGSHRGLPGLRRPRDRDGGAQSGPARGGGSRRDPLPRTARPARARRRHAGLTAGEGPAAMSPAPRRARVWLGTLLGAAFLAAMVWTTLAQSGAECEVCLEYRGDSVCRTAAASDADTATQQAIATACAILSQGVTQGLECQRTPPRSLRCDGP